MDSSGRSWNYGYNNNKNQYRPYKNGYNNVQVNYHGSNHNYHHGYNNFQLNYHYGYQHNNQNGYQPPIKTVTTPYGNYLYYEHEEYDDEEEDCDDEYDEEYEEDDDDEDEEDDDDEEDEDEEDEDEEYEDEEDEEYEDEEYEDEEYEGEEYEDEEYEGEEYEDEEYEEYEGEEYEGEEYEDEEYYEYYDYNNCNSNDNPYKNKKARNGQSVKQPDYKNKAALVMSYPPNYIATYSGRIWDEAEVLAIAERVSVALAQTFIKLLNEGCTLPFIARYRKDSVNYLRPDRLHELYESYQRVIHMKSKVTTVLDTLKKSSKLTQEVETSILNARTLADLELVYAPLKTQAISLVEKAKKLGLEPHANKALKGEKIDLKSLCTSDEEKSSVEKVEAHITHLIADIIHKDSRVLKKIKKLKYETEFTIQSKLNEDSLKEKKNNEKTKYNTKTDPETYRIYFDWSCNSQLVKPHQTLALNRGEDENILAVQVIVPYMFYNELERLCVTLWSGNVSVRKGLKDAYDRFILPWLVRQVRSDLTNKARKEAVKTFTTNLETYLLTEPVKNMRIAGLDPGFKNGCKVGVIETTGEKLAARAIFPDLRKYNRHDNAATKLKDMLHKYHVTLIGLGNGTACRETEKWLKDHEINIPIVIVPEQGASIYSISKEAQNEHPDMDPNLISALSIARRVLDPLGELIKVEPKNLGVGMYQHDIPPKMLESALDGTVEKVVSLVGVDINTASHAMLRRIAGLNDTKAKKLIAYRQKNHRFVSRAEIVKVDGIDEITYQQCAGFLKVIGGSEPLDSTIIHPESYSIAKRLATKIRVNVNQISHPNFPQTVEKNIKMFNIKQMSEELGTNESNLQLIISAFKQRSKEDEDNFIHFCKPVYSLTVHDSELREGVNLTGVVRNVVPFGCFVDCGVGDNGLIHRSQYGAHSTPKLGDRVCVTVIAPPKPKKLQLRLDGILD